MDPNSDPYYHRRLSGQYQPPPPSLPFPQPTTVSQRASLDQPSRAHDPLRAASPPRVAIHLPNNNLLAVGNSIPRPSSAPPKPTPDETTPSQPERHFAVPLPTTTSTGRGPASSLPPVRITLVGAGPTSLAFAIHLASKVDERLKSGMDVRRVKLDIYDPRLRTRENGVVDWLGPNDTPRNIRRQQCITLQDDVMALFDDDGVPISDHIWKNQPGERAWPTSRQSAICTVEDRLIAFAQEEYLKPYIQIHDERMTSEKWDRIKADDASDFVVIADGGGPSSFSALPELGFHHEELGEADTALGIYYEREGFDPPTTAQLQAQNVYLTLFQTIYLVNSYRAKRGYLNVRLPPSYMELLMHERAATLQELASSDNIIMQRTAAIIRAGLDMFDIGEDKVKAINYISLPMRFVYPPVRQLDFGSEKRIIALVLGDAALKHHFWPGRGANSGLKGAANLAWHFLHFLTASPQRATSRTAADFAKYGALMSELKLREHEGRGAYVQELDAEQCFREAFGDVDPKYFAPGWVPKRPHHTRAASSSISSTTERPGIGGPRGSVDSDTMVLNGEPAYDHTSPNLDGIHPAIKKAVGKYIDGTLFMRLVARRDRMAKRPPFNSSVVHDVDFQAALKRLSKHGAAIKLLLCASGEWPTEDMARSLEVRPPDHLPQAAKDAMDTAASAQILHSVLSPNQPAPNAAAVKRLLPLLESPTTVTVVQACDKLRDVASLPQGSSLIIEAGFAKPLVDLLWARQEEIVQGAASVLQMIARGTDSDRAALVAVDIFVKLRPLLNSHVPAILAEACWTISDMCHGNAFEQNFAEAGFSYPLVALLKDHNPTVATAALSALRKLAFTIESERTTMHRAGILGPLGDQLALADNRVVGHACLTIGILATSPPIRTDIMRSPIAPALVDLLLSRDEKVVFSVVEALKSVVAGTEDEKRPLVDAGIFTKLTPLFKSPDPRMIASACEVISWVTFSATYRSAAIAAGLQRTLISFLWHQDAAVVEEIVGTLQNLALGSDSDKSALVDAGLLPKLRVLLLQARSNRILVGICYIIANLGPKYFKSSSIQEGFKEPLAQLSGHPDPNVRTAALRTKPVVRF